VSTPQSPDNEWQRIWFSIRQHTWSSLALVPSHSGIDVVKVAQTLVATGRLQGERPVGLIDATGVRMSNIQQVIGSLGTVAERGEHAIVPVDAIHDNPSTIAIVQAASMALLVVRLGESLLASAQTTLDVVGRNRFIGSIVVDGAGNVSLR
jgi:hypothetical protein